jgi:hypothetical protein
MTSPADPDTRLLSDAQLEDAKKTGAGKTA